MIYWRSLINRYKFILFLLMIGLLAISWFQGDFLIKAGDSFFSLLPKFDLYRFSFIWDRVFVTGIPNPRGLLKLPYFFICNALDRAGVSLVTSEKLQFYILFTLSGLSMYYLMSSLLSRNEEKIGAFFSAVFYMMNPFTLTIVWRQYISLVYAYAIFPLIFLIYIKTLDSKNLFLFILVVLLVITLFSVSLLNPAFFAPIILALFIYFIYRLIYYLNGKIDTFDVIKRNLFATVVGSLLNFWWIIPTVYLVQDLKSAATVSGGFLKIFTWTNIHTSLLNTTRLLGDWHLYASYLGEPYFSWQGIYFSPFFVILSFLVPILAFSSLLIKKYRKLSLFFAILSLIGLFLAKGNNPPGAILNILFLEKIPFAGMFRNSYEKFGILISFSYSVLLGFLISGLHTFFDVFLLKFKRCKLLQFLPIANFILLFFVLELVYMFPFWTGDVIYPGGKRRPSHRIRIPSYYKVAGEYIAVDNREFRIISVPPACKAKTATYDWEYGYYGSDSLEEYFFLQKPLLTVGLTGNENITEIQSLLLKSIFSRNPLLFFRLSAMTNTKYVLNHLDFNLDYVPYVTPPYSFRKALNYILGEPQSFGKIDIYRVPNYYFLPHIYSSASNVIVYDNIDTMINILQTTSFDKLPLFIEKNHLKLTNLDRLSLAKTLPTVIFRKINPTRYEVKVENATGPFFLVFLESYHPKWKAYVEMRNRNWKTETRHWEIIAEYPKINVKEAKHEMRFTPKDVAYLFKKPLPEKYHLLVNGYANAWFIDPNEIGKQNFTITLYFWPQSLFYLGLFISGVTLLGCLGYLGYERIKG